MRDFFEVLVSDQILFFIIITILILIILVLVCILLLRKKYYHPLMLIEQKAEVKPQKEVPEIPKPTLDLEHVLKEMQAEMDDKEASILEFEHAQEEEAIISYEELKKAVKKPELESIPSEERFQTTEFISPIFGKQTVDTEPIVKLVEPKVVEPVVSIPAVSTNADQFLYALKEFRKNLE